MTHKTALAAQVAAWNRANAEANRLAVQLAEIFKPFLGKKVTCNGGSLTKKVKDLLPSDEWNKDGSLRTWHSSSPYSLYFIVKACETEDKGDGYGHAFYAETYISVGELKNHDLEKVNDPCTDRRTDYAEEEITAKRKAVEAAEKAFHDAESDLSPFKRHDW